MRIYVPFVAMIAAVAGTADAQTAPPPPSDAPTGWVVDGKTGCKVREDAADPAERITWSGRCEDGMAEGSGTLQFYIGDRPGARYDGEMRGGRADGHGVSLEPGGARYDGQWRNNAANGPGVYTLGGARYEGIWSNGCLRQGSTELAVGVSRESCGFK